MRNKHFPSLVFIVIMLLAFSLVSCDLLDDLLGNNSDYKPGSETYPTPTPSSGTYPTPTSSSGTYPTPTAPGPPNININQVYNDGVDVYMMREYIANLDPGSTYAVSIFWMDGDVDLTLYSGPNQTGHINNSSNSGTNPERITYISGFNALYVVIDNYALGYTNYDFIVEELPNPYMGTFYPVVNPTEEYAIQYIAPSSWRDYEAHLSPGSSYEIFINNMNEDLDLFIYADNWDQIDSSENIGTMQDSVYLPAGTANDIFISVYNNSPNFDSGFTIWMEEYPSP